MKLDILAIGVHPDDIELSCSGTILKHIALGKKCGILDLTSGELGTRGSGELRLEEASNSAKILSYSPLEFIGTENAPIFIHSTDKSGQGIIVINANQKSILRYTVFENLSTPSQGGWKLSGTISFYESPV